MTDTGVWMLCSACRKELPFRAVHWVCSVSTCNRSRTRLVFCSVACWDSHVATFNHRDAWAVEAQAPSRKNMSGMKPTWTGSARPAPPSLCLARACPSCGRNHASSCRPAAAPSPAPPLTAHAGGPALSSSYAHDDVLVVVSKVKKYIRDRSGMNTSDAVAEALGDHVRSVCDEAIRAAARDGRKTVLDRDVPKARR